MPHWLLIVTMIAADGKPMPVYFGPYESERECLVDSQQMPTESSEVKRVCEPRIIRVDHATGNLYYVGER